MKTISVVAAIIEHGNRIFATQRGYGEFKDMWEFPGGKVENDEKPEDALVREIKEELDILIEVRDLITTVEYDYPDFHLSMMCFDCKIVKGRIVLKEHEASTWLSMEELNSVQWLPADLSILPLLQRKHEED